jgi:hypothetical protein
MVQQVALTLVVWDRTNADVLTICVSAGWSWLICLHLMGRPSFAANVLPVAMLLLITWGYDFDPQLCWYARSHAVVMLLVMVGVCLARPDSRYPLLIVCTAGADGVFYPGRWVGTCDPRRSP